MIILSTILLIFLNGVISAIITARFGRNYSLAYAVFSAIGITYMLVAAAEASL